jgi:hypothetical protein
MRTLLRLALLLFAPVAFATAPPLHARSLHFGGSDVVMVSLPQKFSRQVTIETWVRSAVDSQSTFPVYVGSLAAPVNGYGLVVHDG